MIIILMEVSNHSCMFYCGQITCVWANECGPAALSTFAIGFAVLETLLPAARKALIIVMAGSSGTLLSSTELARLMASL